MAATFESSSSTPTGNVSAPTITITAPTGIAEGDFLLAFISCRTTESIDTDEVPSGWVLQDTEFNGNVSTRGKMHVYTKIATDSEPASYQWGFQSNTYPNGGILRYSGVDITDPIGELNMANSAGSGLLSFDCPSVTSAEDNTTVIAAGLGTLVTSGVNHSMTPPGTYTERIDNGGSARLSLGVSDVTKATAGATGAQTYTDAVESTWVTAQLYLNDAPANYAPTADAGEDQTIIGGNVVNLDGSGSSDVDGTIDSYSWSQTSGTSVTLTGDNTATPSFTAPASAATLVFELTVTDNDGAESTDTVTINVEEPITVKVWNGSTWDDAIFKVWDGGSWV